MLNVVAVTGRLVADPEMQNSKDGKTQYCKFTVACRRDYGKDKEDQTDFFRCLAYSAAARYLAGWCHKGDEIDVQGRLRNNIYEKDGKKNTTTEIVAMFVHAHHGSPYDGPVTVQKTEGSIHPNGNGNTEAFTDEDFFDFPY